MTFEDLLASNTALRGQMQRSEESLKIALLVDKSKVGLAYLRRMNYGRSSEQLQHAQLELVGGQTSTRTNAGATVGDGPGEQEKSNLTSIESGRKKRQAKQRPGPSRPIERVMAGAGVLAHVLVSEYADHTPLHRQCQIYAREGLELERSTLMIESLFGKSTLMRR